MDEKYKTSELIKYLDNLELIDSFGILMNFGTPDKLRLVEIKNKLLELEKIKENEKCKYCGKNIDKCDCLI